MRPIIRRLLCNLLRSPFEFNMAPKKFKMKKYEKDDDDHYIVIIEPWTHGIQDIADANTVNYIAAWLRVMLRKVKEKGIVRAIYTVGQVSESICSR